MEVTNRQILTTCPFDEYLRLPGWSYSGIRGEGVTRSAPSQKMQLGTAVGNYLATPELYNHDNPLVKPAAMAIKNVLGESLLRHLKPELAVTADFTFAGLKMAYKGRLDFSIPNRLVVELKVSQLANIRDAIRYFGYNLQVNGYQAAIGAKTAVLISIHPGTLKTTVIQIPYEEEWWHIEIKKRGLPV